MDLIHHNVHYVLVAAAKVLFNVSAANFHALSTPFYKIITNTLQNGSAAVHAHVKALERWPRGQREPARDSKPLLVIPARCSIIAVIPAQTHQHVKVFLVGIGHGQAHVMTSTFRSNAKTRLTELHLFY